MEFIVSLGLIFVYASMLTIIFKERISKVILLAITEIVLIIYVFGLFDNLLLGVKCVKIFSIIQILSILFILCIQKEKNDLKNIIKRIIVPELFLYLFLCLIAIVLNKNRIFEDYDDFTHWGRIIKNMFMTNSFGLTPNSVITFSEYPPITAIFQYLFLTVKNVYAEDIVIIAQNILYFSIIIYLFSNMFKKEKIKDCILFIIIIFLLPVLFYKNFYLDILVDGLLGVLFAMSIFISYEEENKHLKFLNIFSCLMFLVLMKTTGIALALLAFFIILIKNIKLKNTVISLIIIFVIIALLVLSWYVKASNGIKRWDFNNYIEVTNKTEKEEKNIVKTYLIALLEKNAITEQNYTISTMFVFIILLMYYLNVLIKNKDFKYYTIWMFVSLIIYLLFILFSYVTIFDISEASRLTSFSRYCFTIFIAIFLFFITVRFKCDIRITKLETLLIVLILFILLPFNNIKEKYINSKEYINNSILKRNVFTQIVRYKDILDNDDKVLYITGNEGITLYALAQYEIIPQKLSGTIEDVNSIDEFEQILYEGAYTHVYVYRMSDEVEYIVKELFEEKNVKNDYLYEVIKEENSFYLRRK